MSRAATGSRTLTLVLLLVATLLTGCDSTPQGPRSACPRLTFGDVVGVPPAHLPHRLSRSTNDGALCAGWWIPRTARNRMVPQGLAVRGHTAWVSGYDDARLSRRFCRVLRMDLRTGRSLAEHGRIRAADLCRHGGGLAIDSNGLWLIEKVRLWLLDPETLDVRRTWELRRPVWGSYLVRHDHRLGIAGWGRRPRLFWYDVRHLLAPTTTTLTPRLAIGSRPAPRDGQGALMADLDGVTRLWWVRSTSRCGVLGGSRSVGFLPGAEGTSVVGKHLYAISESTVPRYQRKGDRPVVPALARYDLSRFRDWASPTCDP